MLVGFPSESLHHGRPDHAALDAPLPPAATQQHDANMEAAVATAAADAPTHDAPDVPMADAPADPNLTTTTLPALGDPITFQPSANNMATDINGVDLAADLLPMDLTAPPKSDERLTAFARLRFDDGSYYMHTYQIMLGRNLELAHKDMRRLAKVDQLNAAGHLQAAEKLLKKGKKRRRHGARSVISEKGGIVSAPIESMPMEYRQRRHSNASHSLSSASHPNADSGEERPPERAPQDVLMQAFPEVPAQFEGQVNENPYDCPLVPIHPQHVTDRSGAFGPKGISREHAKIYYDYEQGHFCIEVLGSNGLRHEDRFLRKGENAPLEHGDRLSIGAVNIQFYLPDIALTEDQRHRQGSGSRPMSFQFENGHGELESDEQISSESEGEQSINPRHVYHYPIDSEIESDDAAGDDDMDEYEEPIARSRQKPSVKLKLKVPPPTPTPKEVKKAQKRKLKEATPEEVPVKKSKTKHKESVREQVKESRAAKEPKEFKEPKEPKETKEVKELKEPKDKGKAPAKTPVKEESAEDTPKETPVKEKAEPSKSVPSDSPPLLRKPLEGELEAGEIEGLITEEMAREHNLPATLIGQVVEKRKGPGRPPKDGIMSKRQRSQLIKQAKEIEKAKAAGLDPSDIPMLPMKPKAPKRKDSNAIDGEDGDIRESTENGDGTGLGGQRQTKPMKPPRTPSPEMRESDYTEEQLQRPSANYVVLIHEAISSSSTGQMNLQQIYNYIEKKYPWYKFKTTTSGWQSSVRHNLGQHDAFVKGDKEGKGFNWKINPEVSIEKERRKRQVSPPVNHAQRQTYYPPQNGYAPYGQPGYPYHPGMPPHGMPPAAPRLPPSLANAQPRLPPSMARDSNTATPSAPSGAPHASPYASPWAGGNAAGSPSTQAPPRPYPQPNSQTPPVSTGTSGSGYGVLYPSSAPQAQPAQNATASPYSGPYGNGAPSPYGPARPYAPYPPPGHQPPGAPGQSTQPQGPPQHRPQSQSHAGKDPLDNVPPGRYPPTTHPDLIRQLEAFRRVYLETRIEPGEDQKVDNAIRAYTDPNFALSRLNDGERSLYDAISGIAGLQQYRTHMPPVQQAAAPAPVPTTSSTTSAGTAAAIAADQAASTATTNSQPQSSTPAVAPAQASAQYSANEPQRFIPTMTGQSPSTTPNSGPPSQAPPLGPAPAVPSLPPSHRPSVEPLTPVPGSPAVQNGTPVKRSFTEITAESIPTDAQTADSKNADNNNASPVEEQQKPKEEEMPPKTE